MLFDIVSDFENSPVTGGAETPFPVIDIGMVNTGLVQLLPGPCALDNVTLRVVEKVPTVVGEKIILAG